METLHRMTERMQMVATLISKGVCAAEVGCDHAYLSIFLLRHGIKQRAIAMDIREGPLAHARANIALYGCAGLIETRLGDGLAPLAAGEADSICIAGMGGGLMRRILEEGSALLSGTELVLQPQSEAAAVRRYLRERGFVITQERMCREFGKFYMALRAVEGKELKQEAPGLRKSEAPGLRKQEAPAVQKSETPEQEVCDRYGRLLLQENNPVLRQLLETEATKQKRLDAQLRQADTPLARERLILLERERELLAQALAYYR